jgi:ABC-type lipoprotein release transport system permease subunit
MTTGRLAWLSLRYFWQTNLAVIGGVAIAVATLVGALLVGDSVRGSLRDLVLNRLGKTETVVTSALFFRDALSRDLNAAPLIALEGVVSNPKSKASASGVQVYGIDDRFWQFHGVSLPAPADREVYLSAALADELQLKSEDGLLVRIEKPSAIPKESLHGRKDEATRSIRFAAGRILDRSQLGEFSLRPTQGPVRAVFVPLRRLQRDLEQAGRVNTLLLAEKKPAAEIEKKITLQDLGVRVRQLESGLAVESESALLNDSLVSAVRKTFGDQVEPVFSYLANSIRDGERQVPYSLVAGVDPKMLPAGAAPDSIFLTQWPATDLGAKVGDVIQLDYYVWEDSGTLTTRSAEFKLAGILPMTGVAIDRQLTPDYPGITDAATLGDWNPPFPVDLKRVRPKDEEFWKQYRTAPKALLPVASGQKLWASRFGRYTSIRLPNEADASEAAKRLRAAIDPQALGLAIVNPRDAGLSSSKGSTDFGEYFTYFSFFLVIAALLLAGLFFRLSVEQRLREIGSLRALGLSQKDVRRLFLTEGALLALLGTLAGIALGIGYAAGLLYALTTWWRGAVGTTLLALHVTPQSIAGGAIGGFVVALLWMFWTLRGLRRESPRSLLSGSLSTPPADRPSRAGWISVVAFLGALGLIAAAFTGAVPQAGAFFGAGFLLLSAALFWQWSRLKKRLSSVIGRAGHDGVGSLGLRNTAYRPGRSLLSITLIALATFLLVSLDAFRRPAVDAREKASGAGGYPLIAEAQLPVFYDLNTPAGQESLGLSQNGQALARSAFVPFRLRPGEDASCLNLYAPRNPRILGAKSEFLRESRFSFQESSAQSEEDKRNPWLLLEKPAPKGVIPAIADANSLAYVLHKKIGEDIVINPGTPQAVTLRIVGALADSIFQGELIVSEKNFLSAFPGEQGYRVWLIDTPGDLLTSLPGMLEEGLSDYGLDVTTTGARLASFHQVENTYLSTFQALGGLGLLLGTLGLAAVLLRNVLERRRELALLRAVGYTPGELSRMVLAENVYLLAMGLLVGIGCAAFAIAPAFLNRGGHLPNGSLALLLLAIPVAGLLASVVAVRSIVRAPLVGSLKAE